MTTPPLDLPALRETAEAATPGPWNAYGYRVETVPEFDLHRFDVMGEMVADCDLLEADARHIAAFDPPTVLALLDRVESAESSLARYIVERTRFGDAMAANAVAPVVDAIMRELTADSAARAEAAEKKVAAVREVHKSVPVYTTEAGDCEHDGDCEAVEISAGSYCPVHTDGLTCNECAELAEHADDLPAYPCPTIIALDTHETETAP